MKNSFNFKLPDVILENMNDDEDVDLTDEEVEEVAKFVAESAMHILLEGDDKDELIDSGELDELEKLGVVKESSVVRLDRESRIRQLTKIIGFKIAREKKDPSFKKLLRVWRIESDLEKKIHKKYGNKAKRLAQKEVRDNYKQVGRKFVRTKGKRSRKR